MSLSKKVIKGGLWLQVSKFLQLGANFIITAILARLLKPDDFGLVGIVTIYTMFISRFTVIGFGTAIIQRQDVNDVQISTLYWLNFIMGISTAIIVFFSAPLAAKIYGYHDLIPLIRLMSINFLFFPLFQLHRKLLEKQLMFPTIAKINVIASVGSGLIGIACAFIGFDVYSLVIQSIALSAINLVAFRFSSTWRSQLTFNIKKVKEMILFALKMKGAQLTRFFERNIDLFILGKLLSPTVFGFYTLANRIIYMPTRRIAYTFGEILFPSFSKIQDNKKKIRKICLKAIQMIAIFVFPAIFIMAIYSKPLTLIILGEKWLPVANVLSILALVGALQAIEILSFALFPALDIPEVSIQLGIIRTVGTGFAVFFGGLFGLISASIALLVVKLFLFVINIRFFKKYIDFGLKDIFKILKGPIFGIISMFIISAAFSYLDIRINLVLKISICVLVYIPVILLINREDLKYFLSCLGWKKLNISS